MNRIRLDKFLSSQLNISRRGAKKLLGRKEVSVNGSTAVKGEQIIDADSDSVKLNGKEILYKKHIYIMLNKPVGVVSASKGAGDVTVIDILPEKMKTGGLFPAGRLDRDTTGFVLITNDGEFAHNILSPRHHVPKRYEVTADRLLTPEEISLFENGMTIGGELLKPAKISLIEYGENTEKPVYELIITQGLYHQIKRMFAAVGGRVLYLHRSAIGGLELDKNLAPGGAREISESELMLICGVK